MQLLETRVTLDNGPKDGGQARKDEKVFYHLLACGRGALGGICLMHEVFTTIGNKH